MSKKSIDEVQLILEEAANEGVISSKALQIINVNDVVLAGVNGMDIDDIQATDVILMTFIYDDSGSIRFAGLADAVRQGQNEMINAIGSSKQKDNILLAQWKLGSSAELVHSYVPIDQAVKLDHQNYDPNSGTALYDTWIEALAANVAYAQKLRASGTPVKSIVGIITDGQDEGSRKYRIEDCKKINKDLLLSEQFILAFVGVGNNAQDETRFRLIAEDMGFPDGAALTAGATATEMRKVFNVFSQSAIRASQKAVSAAAQNSFFTP